MKTRNLFLASLLLATLPLCASADDINANQATQIAKDFDNTRYATARSLGKGDTTHGVRLVKSRMKDGAPLYHLFNRNGGGFVLVAGSDDVRSVLAYSDTDTISTMDEMPPAMQEMIEAYGTYIHAARQRAISSNSNDIPAPTKPVSPLTKTTWNQGTPFNTFCPTTDNGRCITGCVATAMAQIMKYYNYPAKGTGSHSYQWNGQTLTAEPGAHTYNWNKMLPSYSSTTYTNENVQAVAQLMYDCGVTCEADYGTNVTWASIGRQFVDYFGYDSSSAWMKKYLTSNAQWERIINEELLVSRPVYYCAQNKSHEGHLFIVDGCDDKNYFHINWGWGGYKDGYFTLTLPDKLGDYWDRPSCIIGLKPGTETSEVDFTVALPYTLQTPISTMTGAANYGFIRGNFANHSTQDQKVEMGVRFISTTTGKTYYYEDNYTDTWKAKEEYENYYFEIQNLPIAEDTYTVEPIYRLEGQTEWHSFRPLRDDIAPVELQVVNNIEPTNQSIFLVDNPTLASDRTTSRSNPDNLIEMYGNVMVDGNYTGDYIFGIQLKNTKGNATQYIPSRRQAVMNGQEQFIWVDVPTSLVMSDGTYSVGMAYREAAYGSEWKPLIQSSGLASMVKNFVVKSEADNIVPKLFVEDLSAEVDLSNGDPQVTIKTRVKAVNDIKTTLVIYWELGFKEEQIELKAGEIKEFAYTNTYPNAKNDRYYFARVYYITDNVYYPRVNNIYYVLLPPTTDIQQPIIQMASDGSETVSIYLPSGICISKKTSLRQAFRHLKHGTYIIRHSDGTTRRIIF